MVQAVVGANWGDEGKGKITDMLAREGRHHRPFSGRCKRRPHDCEQLRKVRAAQPAVWCILQPYDERHRQWCGTGYSGAVQQR